MNVLVRIGWITGVVTATLLGLDTKPAFALTEGDKEAVRNLSDEAAEDFDGQRYAQARDKFTRAYSVAKIPSLALWTARANEKVGKWVAAYEMYNEALGLERNELWRGEVQQKARKDAAHEMQVLLTRIPRLTVLVEGAEPGQVTVTIDDVAMPTGLLGVERFADPGPHQIAGRAGDMTASEPVKLLESGKATVVLKLRPALPNVLPASQALPKPPASAMPIGNDSGAAPPPQASPPPPRPTNADNGQKLWGWVSVGVGAVGLATGTVAGIVVASKNSDLEKQCGEELQCDMKFESDVESYRTMRTVSVIGFIVGGVATATGVTLILSSGTKGSEPKVGLLVAPGMAALTGAF